jgi:hypothetical protein
MSARGFEVRQRRFNYWFRLQTAGAEINYDNTETPSLNFFAAIRRKLSYKSC